MVFKNGPHHVAGICTTFSDSPDNAAFIAAARSAVPELLEENDRLLEALREIVADDEYTGTRTGHGDRGPAYADTARAALETDHE